MIRVLLWKEYHEHRLVWLMLALVGLALLVGVQSAAQLFGVGTAARDQGMVPETTALAIAWVYGLVCGGMMLAGERENGTLLFLDTLPVRRLSIWLIKAFVGVGFVVALAAVLAGGMSYEVVQQQGQPHDVGLLLLGISVGGLFGLAWGLFLSAYCHYVLNAVFLGFVAQIAASLLIFPLAALAFLFFKNPMRHEPTSEALLEGPFSLAAFAVLHILPIVGSAWVFTRQDSGRLRTKPQREPKAKVRVGQGWLALLWLAARQSRWLALGVVLLSLIAAILMPSLGLIVWPVVTSLVAVLCGVTVFLDEQRQGSYRFLGEQRLPLTRVWLVKVGVRLALVLLSLFIVAAPSVLMRAWTMMNNPNYPYQDQDLSFVERVLKVEVLDLRPAWVFVLLWPAYGFSIGHLNGLMFRKALVALVIALMQCGMIAVLWLPSVVVGGLHFWQVGVIPLVFLAVAWSMMRPWTADRLLSQRPLVTGIAVYLLSGLWLAGSLWYRVEEVSDVPQQYEARYDLDTFVKSLPKIEEDRAGQLIRRSLAHVSELNRELGQRKPSRPILPPRPVEEPLLDMHLNYYDQMMVVTSHGWPGGRPELAGWLDAWFADDSWLQSLAEAAQLPLGVVQSPRDMDIGPLGKHNQEVNTIAHLLVARGLQQQAAGKPEVFVEYLNIGLNLSRNLRHKSPPDQVSTGQQIEEVLFTGLDHWLEQFNGRPELLKQVNDILRRHQAETPVNPLETAQAEYLVRLNSFNRLSEIAPNYNSHRSDSLGAFNLKTERELLQLVLQVPWERARMLRFLHLGQLNLSPAPVQVPRMLKPLVQYYYSIPLQYVKNPRAQCNSVARQLRVALRQYQIENGKPADQLAQLVPNYLPAIPLDPYDGQPFRYRLSRGEFIKWPLPDAAADALPGEGGAAPGLPEIPVPGMIQPQPAAGGEKGLPEGGFGIPGEPPIPIISVLRRWIPAGQGILWSVGEDRINNGGHRQEGVEWFSAPGGMGGPVPAPASALGGTDLIFLVPPPPLRLPIVWPY